MQFEYMTQVVDENGSYYAGQEKDGDNLYEKWVSINELGKQGWELIFVSNRPYGNFLGWFKRSVEPTGISFAVR